MFIEIVLIIVGFFLLIKGADFLVDGASKIAKKFHIPEIVIGLTIVSIGTSMPELIVSSMAAIEGHSDIAIGNVVGSNLANLFLILGACSIIKPLIFKKQTRLIENPVTIFATSILLFFCINKTNGIANIITRKEGIILLGFSLLFIIYNIVMSKKGEQFDIEDSSIILEFKNNDNISVLKSVAYIIIGIVGLKFGGDFVVDGSVNIAKSFGISQQLISLTIIAFSTSLPELITSITATFKGETDMAIGNVLGSQIFNIFLIIGISALLTPIQYSIDYNNDIFVLLIGSILLALFPFIGKKKEMTRANGLSFVIIYAMYIVSLVAFTI